MKGPFWEWSLSALLLFFAPVYIGAFRRWRSRHASWPVWKLLLLVVFTGWTYIGWLWALRMAFKDVPLPSLLAAPSGGGGAGGGWAPQSTTEPRRQQPCTSCRDGSNTCSACSGRGSWHEGSSLITCQSCFSRGTITCSHCGGTGWVG